jgi:hypothetical protein
VKLHLFATALVTTAFATTHMAVAHGVAKVRKELAEQGYKDLEFQRTRPPFKLDACKDG